MAEMNKTAGVLVERNTALQNIKKYFIYKFGEIKKARAYYLFLLPYAIIFTTFTVVPVVVAMGLSFTAFNMVQAPRFIFIDNYYQLFMVDDLFVVALKNTLLFSAIIGPVGYFISLGFAWLINEMPPKFRTLLTFIFYAPSMSGAIYDIPICLFGGRIRVLNSNLLSLNIIVEAIPWLKNEKPSRSAL